MNMLEKIPKSLKHTEERQEYYDFYDKVKSNYLYVF